jgi:ADP-heptose:LPS heptosyltransferase
VIHVSAGSPFRRWPLPSFVDTVAALASSAGRRVIVTSGPSDREAANGIINGARAKLPAGDRHRVLDCGDFSLAELRALLERSTLFIGGDSGPLHLAATTRVPIVAIFGPTPSERSAPWRDPALLLASIEIDGLACRPCDQRICEPGDFRCLTRIDAPRVIAAAERLLAARRRQAFPARADSQYSQ